MTGGIIAIAAGTAHNVAVFTNGNVMAWGDLVPEDPTAAATNVPPSATNASIVSACSFHSLALRNNGTVVGWGYYSPTTENSRLLIICPISLRLRPAPITIWP